jgi:hypothetical protein
MLKELLISLTIQKKSINQVAMDFNTSKDIIRYRLDMLAHLGYLKKIEGCDESPNLEMEDIKSNKKSKITIDKSKDQAIPNYCTNCILAKSCREMNETERKINTGYSLTNKGKKLLSD